MAVDYQKIAEGVLANVGGKDNVASATHCMTRLRLTFKDKSKVNSDAIKGLTGPIEAGQRDRAVLCLCRKGAIVVEGKRRRDDRLSLCHGAGPRSAVLQELAVGIVRMADGPVGKE